MQIGIFGGTFDPVHYGHLLLAQQCLEQAGLDQVWFIPAAVPPHKTAADISPFADRAEMLRLAVAGQPEFIVSTIEADRPGPSFTVDTLEQILSEDSSRTLSLLIGADSLADLPQWREPSRICQLAQILAVNRDATELDTTAVERLEREFSASVQTVSMPHIGLSATDLRDRVRSGRSIRFMTPPSVEMYIREHQISSKR